MVTGNAKGPGAKSKSPATKKAKKKRVLAKPTPKAVKSKRRVAAKPEKRSTKATKASKPRVAAKKKNEKAPAKATPKKRVVAKPKPKTKTKKARAPKKATRKRIAAKKSSSKGTASKKKVAKRKVVAKKSPDKKRVAKRKLSKKRPSDAVSRPVSPSSKSVEPAKPINPASNENGSILVTGICGRLGKLVARKLHRNGHVIGIDRRPFSGKPKDISHYQIDVRRSKTRDVFRRENIRAVVHLGILHDPRVSSRERHSWNVVAFQKLLEFLRQYDVPKLVVLSSANVYGPQPNNPQFLTEDAPLLGSQEFQSIRDLVELDMLAQGFFWKHPETETVILRPCHILGGVRNAASNYLRLSRPVTVMGFDPMVQPIHERDVVDAIALALKPGVRGIFNLRGPGELPLSRILKHLKRRPRSVPGPLARMALDRMWRMRLTSFPAPELDHIRYLCMVDDTRARTELGFRPSYNLEQTLSAVSSER